MKTFKYTLIQVFFCILICALSGYATVFLLDKQFSNTVIGTVLSVANILGVLCQQGIASVVDNSQGKITARHVVLFSFIAMSIISAFLATLKNATILFLGLFIIVFMFMGVLNPFISAMIFEVDQEGKEINFGLARGLGSASYAVASLVLGNLTATYGTKWLPMLYVVLALIAFCVVLTFKTNKNIKNEKKEKTNNISESKQNFFIKYPTLTKTFIAIILIFFGFNLTNSYLIQIVRHVGGNQSQLGNAMFLAAIVELPAMTLSTTFTKKWGYSKVMMLSAFFFGVKHTLLWLAPNIAVVYLSQLLQFFSYALFIPVSVYFVSNQVDANDAMKGQALMTGAVSVGGVLASAIGGALLDMIGVSNTLLCATIVTWFGAILLMKIMKK